MARRVRRLSGSAVLIFLAACGSSGADDAGGDGPVGGGGTSGGTHGGGTAGVSDDGHGGTNEAGGASDAGGSNSAGGAGGGGTDTAGAAGNGGFAQGKTDPQGSPPAVTTPTADNAPVTATFYVDSAAYNLAPEFVGQNFEAFPMWGADVSMSAFQKQAFGAAGLGSLRYPGGEPGEWSDLLFAGTCKDGSPANWSSPAFASLWSAFAPGGLRALVLQTNPTTQWCGAGDQDASGAHAAALAKAAAAKNIPAAFEVGNEPEISAYFMGGGGEDAYTAKFVEHARAIHAAAPGAKVYGPALCGLGGNCSFPVTWDSGWLAKFLAATGNKASGPGKGSVDGVSFHVYLHPEWNYSDLSQANTDLYGFAQYWPQTMMPYVRAQIAKYDDRDLPVMISEVGVGTAGGEGNGSMSAVLRTLDTVGAFALSGVHAFQWFDANAAGPNDYWMITTTSPRPVFYAFAAWAQMGDRVLNYDSTAAPHDVAVYGTTRPDGTVQALVINKTKTPHAVTLNFRGWSAAGKPMRVTTIESADGSDTTATVVYNGANAPAAAALPAPKVVTAPASPSVSVAPYSIAVVSLGP